MVGRSIPSRYKIGNKEILFLISVFALFVIFSALIILNHELWADEVRAWLIASESDSLNELVEIMRLDEGHPYLWNVMLYGYSHYISDNVEHIKIIHILISTLAIFLFLKYAPFNRYIKILFVFSYYPFYEYTVISRNYSIGILFFVIFLILQKNKQKNLVWSSIALFFMGQTNIFAFLISICFFINLMVQLYFERRKTPVNKVSLSFSISIILGSIAFAYWQLGSQFQNYSGNSIVSILKNPVSGYMGSTYRIARGFIGAYLPIPNIDINFFNTNLITDILLNQNVFSVLILGFIFLMIPIFFIKKRFIFCYFISTFSITLIPFFIYKCSFRHFGHFFLIFIGCLWLSNYQEDDGFIFKKDFARKTGNIFLIFVLSISVLGSIIASYYDIKYPFSNGKNVADYIQENYSKDNLIIVGYQDYTSQAVATYLQKDIYSPQSDEFQKFVKWQGRRGELEFNEITADLQYFSRNNDQVLLLLSRTSPGQEEILSRLFFEKIDRSFDDAILDIENHYLYIYDKSSIEHNSKKIIEINKSDFSKYWEALNQIEFEEKEKGIFLDVSGEDPYFESDFPIIFIGEDDILINILIETSADGDLQVYFAKNDSLYSEGNSMKYAIYKGDNDIFIKIPNDEDLEKIRIDPIASDTDCLIKKTVIYSYKS